MQSFSSLVSNCNKFGEYIKYQKHYSKNIFIDQNIVKNRKLMKIITFVILLEIFVDAGSVL
jgi:hypothetical protein